MYHISLPLRSRTPECYSGGRENEGPIPVTTRDIASLKKALAAAGVEIYRSDSDTLHIAERVRLHIMDAGVRVRVSNSAAFVGFTARSQRSDFPHATADSLFDRVRDGMRDEVAARGYAETTHQTIE